MLKNDHPFSPQMILIYGLAFLALSEWLRSLPVITDTGNLFVFVSFTLFCFVLMYLRVVSYIAFPTIFIAMMYGLHHIFMDGFFIKEVIAMLVWFGGDLALNIGHLWNSNIELLSHQFRSFLLFFVLAITSYLIHFWIFHVKKIFFFLLITISYIAAIDTFTVYDGSSAIVRLVVASFLLLSILFKIRLEAKEQIRYEHFRGSTLTKTLVVLIAAVVMIAYALPKYEPLWADPLPLVRGVITGEQSVGTTNQTVGYSQNDETLGGGFADNSSIVFTAVTKQGHYWRGESKEIYTGKGWQSVNHELNRTFRYSDYYDQTVSVPMFAESIENEVLETTVSMVDGHRFWHFFYPGELLAINELKFYGDEAEEQPFRYLIDYISGKVGTTLADDGKPTYLKEYTFTHKTPKFIIADLKKPSLSDPENIEEIYLQLPDLPARIGELASAITAEYDNRYDRVKSIEGYFSENNFKYETSDVAIPGADQDYVDQFLFETQQGYCDNYSTAMVVMLRTLDIPTRWVKGFTQGEIVEDLGDGYKEYEIANSNAHSWVEVYFPNVGWVPFEPTKGFDQTVEFIEESLETDANLDEIDQEKDGDPGLEKEKDPGNPLLSGEDDMDAYGEGGSAQESNGSNLKSFKLLYKVVGIVIAMIVITFILHNNRKKLITLFYFYLFKMKRSDGEFYVKAYQRLLSLLALNGYSRLNGETLREYAGRIDQLLDCTQMTELTLIYEKLYYGNMNEQHLWKDKKATWEQLVKKMSS